MSLDSSLHANIPEELKALQNWVCFDLIDGKKVPFTPGTDNKAASNRPLDWRSFRAALKDVESGRRQHLGFTFSSGIGYVFIDLDDPDDDEQKRVLERIDSYAQRSIGGHGIHIICKGKFEGSGKHPAFPAAGLFKENRFCLMTGDVLENRTTINAVDEADLQSIHTWLGGGTGNAEIELVEYKSEIPDQTVFDIGCERFVKFSELCCGRWQQFEEFHNNHSNADHAFIAMLCDLTESNEQVRWFFAHSGMWNDERAAKKAGHGLTGYVNRSIKKIRSQQSEAKKNRDRIQLDQSEETAKNSALPPKCNMSEEDEVISKDLAEFLVNHAETLGMSWDEIDALRPPYVIDQFLRRGEVMLTGAESKTRKSWLVQDAGFCVATGFPWLADEYGENGFATAQARVHVLDLELNPSEMRFRFAKARGNRFPDSPEDAAAMTASFSAYSFDGMNVRDIMPRIAEVQNLVQPGDLVILDCLYRLVPDGNETADVAAILETVKRFAAETQAGVIVVDHFRKAGDDKARNRFAGSFVKQASASTLVAIEVIADDVLVLNIDARTFHGCPKVHARFNLDTYAFNRLPEIEVAMAKANRTQAVAEGWILQLWKDHPKDAPIGAADAAERWEVRRQTATPRLGKLVSRGWLTEKKHGHGKATAWQLTPDGLEIIKSRNQAP